MKRFLLCIRPVAVAGIVLVGSMSQAQVANNTALVGAVVDPSGAPVAGAKVTAVNEGTQVTYPGTTNAEGNYSITFIVPGTYDITVEQSGFSKLTKTGRIVVVDQAQRTDFKLAVGSAATSVTVSRDICPICTRTSAPGISTATSMATS